MFLDKLNNLMLPPDNIDIVAIEKNIELVEKHCKLKFPQDYIHFMTTYGSGQINEFIYKYFTRQILCKGFPDSLLESDKPRFISNKFNFKIYCG